MKYEIVRIPCGGTPEFPLDLLFSNNKIIDHMSAYTLTENGWHEEWGCEAILQEFPTLSEVELALSKFWTKRKVHSVSVTERLVNGNNMYGCVVFLKSEK